MELVGTFEIGELLRVSKPRVHQLITREDFPTPAARLHAGFVWRRQDVERWAKRHDYPRGAK